MDAKVKANPLILRILSQITAGACLLIVTAILVLASSYSVFSQTESDDDFLYKIEFEKETLLIPCPLNCRPVAGENVCSDDPSLKTRLKVLPNESGLDTEGIWFEFTPDTGEVLAAGESAEWTLRGARPGTYWLRVKINSGFETLDVVSKSIEIRECTCTCFVSCAKITVEADKTEIAEEQIVVFRVIQSPVFSANDNIDWTVENGEIISGTGSRILRVKATGAEGSVLKVRAELTKNSRECSAAAESEVSIIASNE